MSRLVPLALAVVVAAIAYLVLSNSGHSDTKPATTTHATTPAHAHRHPRRPVLAGLGPDPLRGAAARRARVPVLMYHLVNPAPPGAPYPELWVPPQRFAAELRALHGAGYRAVTLDRVLDAWQTGKPLPHKPIVFTFDDGYESQVTKALPMLRKLGWPAVLNLEWKNLGPKGLPRPQIRELLRAGWELDSHTLTHPDLTTVGPTQLRRELVVSRQRLRRAFGVPVDAFCYPAGRYDAQVQAEVRAAGYRAATTIGPALAAPSDDRTALPRIRVEATATPAELLARVAQ